MDRLSALLALFRKGSEVANPGAWKNATVIANLLLALGAAAAVYGFKVDITPESAKDIAGGFVALLALVNSVVHIVTSTRAGLPAPNQGEQQ